MRIGLDGAIRSARAAFRVAGLEARVYKWTPDATAEGAFLYATDTSTGPTRDGTSHPTEFFVGLLPAQDDVASPLAALALYPVRELGLRGRARPIPRGAAAQDHVRGARVRAPNVRTFSPSHRGRDL
jgi:hypothetical protein